MWTDLSLLGQREDANAPVPTSLEPVIFGVHSLPVEQWF